MKGSLVVDAGCATALLKGGSLLASGVKGVDGTFGRGDPVGVQDADGKPVAQGLVEYSSAEIERIKGRRSEEHADLLGYAPRSAVIHRDQLVLL
jgi:glutamate 5-kinase